MGDHIFVDWVVRKIFGIVGKELFLSVAEDIGYGWAQIGKYSIGAVRVEEISLLKVFNQPPVLFFGLPLLDNRM
jgi:hypothetical protein